MVNLELENMNMTLLNTMLLTEKALMMSNLIFMNERGEQIKLSQFASIKEGSDPAKNVETKQLRLQ
jgi:hypothetical protein